MTGHTKAYRAFWAQGCGNWKTKWLKGKVLKRWVSGWIDFKGPVPCPSSASWKAGTARKDPRGSNTIALPPPCWSVSVCWEHFPSVCSSFHIDTNVSIEHCSGDLETSKGPNQYASCISLEKGRLLPLSCIWLRPQNSIWLFHSKQPCGKHTEKGEHA